jgi:anti-anti-sigma factor
VDGCHRVVFLTGELDIAAAEVAYVACVVDADRDVVVDLGSVTFMDSCGYRGLSATRNELQQLGLSMAFRSLGGQPARLVGLLAATESRAGVATSPSTIHGVGLEQSFGSAGTAGTTITANLSRPVPLAPVGEAKNCDRLH